MPMLGSRAQRGIGKFEFVIVVIIIGVVSLLLAERLNHIEMEAERTEVDLTIRNIRVGIQLAVGEHVMHGEDARIAEIAEIADASPVDFLGYLPRGFRAEASYPEAAGEWAYNIPRRELAYRPRLPKAFDGREELRWRYERRLAADGRSLGPVLKVED